MQDSDQAAGRLREIADVIHKALRDPEFIRLANEPDTDKSSRMEGEDMPESAQLHNGSARGTLLPCRYPCDPVCCCGRTCRSN
jgi:hypothetical protein